MSHVEELTFTYFNSKEIKIETLSAISFHNLLIYKRINELPSTKRL